MANPANQPDHLDSTHTHTDTTTKSPSIPQIQIMSPPARHASSRRSPRDTGFPEPFHKGSNTTLPHPDADLSPNACISNEDANHDRDALKRSRLSLRSSRHKRTITSGFISPQHEALHSVLSLVDSSRSSKDLERETTMLRSPSDSIYRFPKDRDDSFRSRKDDETPPTSPDGSELTPQHGLFKKWLNK